MEFKTSLSNRIVTSCVLLTTVVSGLFALGIAVTIDVVEESLINDEMKRELALILEDYRQGLPLALDKSTQFFTDSQQLPAYLQGVVPGFIEIELNRHDYYVYHLREGDRSYYLVRSEDAFEKREDLIEYVVLIGFFLSIITSFLLGRFLSRKVIAPVERLTHQVRNREKLLIESPPLSPDYANDEVGTLAKAFDTTFAQLHQALQREALFTSDVSHELRTPLMVIISSCDLLVEKKSLDDYTRQRVEMISKAAEEIQALVEAFLALARGRDTQMETASLKEIIQAGFPIWQQQAEGKGLAFKLHTAITSSNAAVGHYPAILLRTVLNNLVRNAIHHTDQGEISLRLVDGGFELRDSGSGIASDEKQRVFEPFYRGEFPHKNSLGLGLSLVQRICEREHWTIVLEDNLPRGCFFTVSLG